MKGKVCGMTCTLGKEKDENYCLLRILFLARWSSVFCGWGRWSNRGRIRRKKKTAKDCRGRTGIREMEKTRILCL